MHHFLKSIQVRAIVGDRARGRLTAGRMVFACALGPAGIVVGKREGDGATPRAALAVRRMFRRPDRGPRLPVGFEVRAIRRDDGWCDDVRHRLYNRLIKIPFSWSHEAMWRDDGLYDLVVELGWNDRPARPGRGSAIFMHAARPGLTPTSGCVALAPGALRRVASAMAPDAVVRIGLGPRKVRR